MFELPSRKDVSKCVITKETIQRGLKPTLVTSAGGPALDLSPTSSCRRVGLEPSPTVNVGDEFGPSEWLRDRPGARSTGSPSATDDPQWIARRSGRAPRARSRTTIAHGFLTLSCSSASGTRSGRGSTSPDGDRLRHERGRASRHAVPVGSRVRGRFTVARGRARSTVGIRADAQRDRRTARRAGEAASAPPSSMLLSANRTGLSRCDRGRLGATRSSRPGVRGPGRGSSPASRPDASTCSRASSRPPWALRGRDRLADPAMLEHRVCARSGCRCRARSPRRRALRSCRRALSAHLLDERRVRGLVDHVVDRVPFAAHPVCDERRLPAIPRARAGAAPAVELAEELLGRVERRQSLRRRSSALASRLRGSRARRGTKDRLAELVARERSHAHAAVRHERDRARARARRRRRPRAIGRAALTLHCSESCSCRQHRCLARSRRRRSPPRARAPCRRPSCRPSSPSLSVAASPLEAAIDPCTCDPRAGPSRVGRSRSTGSSSPIDRRAPRGHVDLERATAAARRRRARVLDSCHCCGNRFDHAGDAARDVDQLRGEPRALRAVPVLPCRAGFQIGAISELAGRRAVAIGATSTMAA